MKNIIWLESEQIVLSDTEKDKKLIEQLKTISESSHRAKEKLTEERNKAKNEVIYLKKLMKELILDKHCDNSELFTDYQ